MKKIYLSINLFFVFYVSNKEYIYPIGLIYYYGEKICLLYQKDLSLQLWFWDPLTKQAWKGLPALYNAANFQLLPNNKFFSFIHNDAIYIKNIEKKSPQLIDFYGPYDIAQIHWDSDYSFYFSALENRSRKIFWKNIYEEVDEYITLASIDSGDCIFPQKFNNSLFYIEQFKNGMNQIVKKTNIFPLKALDCISLKDFTVANNGKDVLYVHDVLDEKLGFLKMFDDKNGYFVSYSSKLIDHRSEVVFNLFFCKDNNINFIFSFVIPYIFLNGKNQLYESVYAFLPYFYNDKFYFVSYESNNYKLYSYDIIKNVFNLYQTYNQIIFSPIVYKNILYYGGEIQNGIKFYQNNFNYYVELPYIVL